MSMASNPEPQHTVIDLDPQSTVMESHAGRPETASFLEVEGGVCRIRLQQNECLVCKGPNLKWEGAITLPKVRGSMVCHNAVERPDL